MTNYGRCKGFTLLEVLVAFLILAGSLGIVMNLLSASSNNTNYAQRHQRALVLAESKLVQLSAGPELQEGRANGEFEPPYFWEAEVAPWDFPDQDTTTDYPVTPYKMTVSVAWGSGDAQRVSLTTVFLVNEDAL